MRIPVLIALLAATPAALADFNGPVVKVQDGDTLTVLVNRTQVRVRLNGIDAPELGQAFGKRSRQSLSDLCAGQLALVTDHGKDRNGRTIGTVRCARVLVNAEQVRRGMAWVYVRYVLARFALYGLQEQARWRRTS